MTALRFIHCGSHSTLFKRCENVRKLPGVTNYFYGSVPFAEGCRPQTFLSYLLFYKRNSIDCDCGDGIVTLSFFHFRGTCDGPSAAKLPRSDAGCNSLGQRGVARARARGMYRYDVLLGSLSEHFHMHSRPPAAATVFLVTCPFFPPRQRLREGGAWSRWISSFRKKRRF